MIIDFLSKCSQGLGFAEFLIRQMCFAVGMNSRKLLGGSKTTDVNEENKLSLKRRSVDEATLNNCEEEEEDPEVDCSNWGSNGGSTVNVYTKRQKTIPSTPPLRLVFRMREASPPPGFEYVREGESPTASDVVEFDDEVLDGQPPSPIITEDDRYSLPLCSLGFAVLFFVVLFVLISYGSR